MRYLKIIRWQNLLILTALFMIIYFGFLLPRDIPLALNLNQFFLLTFATICIVAGGYVIGTIHDVTTNNINPSNQSLIYNHFSENKAYNLYAFLNIIGVGISFYLSNIVGKPNLTGLFIFAAITLFFYASYLKQLFLLGSLLISILAALFIIIPILYTLYPIINDENREALGMLFRVLLDYALLILILSFLREQLKDIASRETDGDHGIQSLPIVLGVRKTAIICISLFLITLVLVVLYVYFYLWEFNRFIATVYVFGFVLTPIIYNLIQLFLAKNAQDFIIIARNIKYIIFFVMLTIWVVNYNILSDVV
jgi:4-hydroxybenzoate polyprenyltransferase